MKRGGQHLICRTVKQINHCSAPTITQYISMESQQSAAYQHGPPPFSAAQMPSQKLAMDIDYEDDRRDRAASVLSGMSQEDMEAAETLNSIQARKTQFRIPKEVSIDRSRFSRSCAATSSKLDPISDHIFAERSA